MSENRFPKKGDKIQVYPGNGDAGFGASCVGIVTAVHDDDDRIHTNTGMVVDVEYEHAGGKANMSHVQGPDRNPTPGKPRSWCWPSTPTPAPASPPST